MKKKTVWSGQYKGIYFEIDNFNLLGDKDGWTFYLYVALDHVPEDIRERFWLPAQKSDWGRTYYSYSDEGLIYGIDFHGGCTWYSKEFGFDGEKRVIKIGCDYQHYADNGREYNEHYLESDVRRAIDSFWELVPGYKVRCQGNGKLYDLSDGTLTSDGGFYSKEWTEQNNKGVLSKP